VEALARGRSRVAAMRPPLHAPALALAALLALGGCGGAAPRDGDPASTEQRAKADLAADAAFEALDRDPLSAARMREAGERLLDAGEPGYAHAMLLAAVVLVEDPPPADPAGKAIATGTSGGSLSSSGSAAKEPADPAGPGGKDALLRSVEAAAKAGLPEARSAATHGPSRDRLYRSRDEAHRLYRDRQYAKALERFEKLTTAEEPRVSRFVASCHMNLAFAAAQVSKDDEAIAHLWSAADADPARRGPSLYRDVARLERRIAVARLGDGDFAACDAALRRAFRAAPDDAETLYLLTRRRDLPALERSWYERRLARIQPDESQAEFLAAAEAVRRAKDATAAAEEVDRFAAKNARQGSRIADLRSLVAERARGEAAQDAASAKARYDEAVKAARDSQTAFESGMKEPAPEPPPEPGPEPEPAPLPEKVDPPVGPAGPVEPKDSPKPSD